MKLKSLLMFVACFALCTVTMGHKQDSKVRARKRILILTSVGGYGHMSTTNMLHELLDAEYDVSHINGIKVGAEAITPHKLLYGKEKTAEESYNQALKGGYLSLTNFVIKAFAYRTITFYSKAIYRKFQRTYAELQPDLVISVIPFMNQPAQRAAHEAGIPYLLMNLDCDLSLFLHKVKKCAFSRGDFLMTVVEKTPLIESQLTQEKIPSEYVFEAGFQVRPEFTTPKDLVAIRKSWKIPSDKKTVLVMMGGQGSVAISSYAKKLAELDKDIHVLFCVGRGTDLIPKIESTMTDCKQTTFQCIPFTTKIADLMAVSDMMISAPKPNSCYEALYSKLPVIVDRIGSCLFWEKATIDILAKRDQVYVLRKMKNLGNAIDELWDRKQELVERSLRTHDENLNPDKFSCTIKKLVRRLLKNAPAESVVETSNGNIVQPA